MMGPRFQFAPEDFARDAIGHGTHAIDQTGQVHGIHPSIRDALIERGLLYLDAEGTWRFTGDVPDFGEARYSHLAICDFCSARPAPWLIPCESFWMPDEPGIPRELSEGEWMACDTCGTFIAAGKRAALLAHCLARPAIRIHESREIRKIGKRRLTQLHQRFWQHYRGGAVRGPVHPFGH